MKVNISVCVVLILVIVLLIEDGDAARRRRRSKRRSRRRSSKRSSNNVVTGSNHEQFNKVVTFTPDEIHRLKTNPEPLSFFTNKGFTISEPPSTKQRKSSRRKSRRRRKSSSRVDSLPTSKGSPVRQMRTRIELRELTSQPASHWSRNRMTEFGPSSHASHLSRHKITPPVPSPTDLLTRDTMPSGIPSQFDSLTRDTMPLVAPSQFDTLTRDTMPSDIPSQFDSLTRDTMPSVAPSQFDTLTRDTMPSVEPSQFDTLTRDTVTPIIVPEPDLLLRRDTMTPFDLLPPGDALNQIDQISISNDPLFDPIFDVGTTAFEPTHVDSFATHFEQILHGDTIMPFDQMTIDGPQTRFERIQRNDPVMSFGQMNIVDAMTPFEHLFGHVPWTQTEPILRDTRRTRIEPQPHSDRRQRSRPKSRKRERKISVIPRDKGRVGSLPSGDRRMPVEPKPRHGMTHSFELIPRDAARHTTFNDREISDLLTAHNDARSGVRPTATRMDIMVSSYSYICTYNMYQNM